MATKLNLEQLYYYFELQGIRNQEVKTDYLVWCEFLTSTWKVIVDGDSPIRPES